MTSKNRHFETSRKDGCCCDSINRKMSSQKYDSGRSGIKVTKPDGTTIKINPEHGIKLTSADSEVTVSTQKTRPTINCTNPSDCPRMQTMQMDQMVSTMTELDKIRLEEAIKEACDSVVLLKTFDDVEEMVEIQNCTEIQRQLTSFINEKRNKLARNRVRREAELSERKQDFYNRVVERIKTDNRERSKVYQHLAETLMKNDQKTSSGSSTDDLAITISQPRFNPQAESTRYITTLKQKIPRDHRTRNSQRNDMSE